MITITSLVLFAVSAIVLHILHAKIAPSHEKLRTPGGRVLLEIAPTTVLARRLSQGRVQHRLALAYRIIWYLHLLFGLVFAASLMISAFFALR